MAKALNSLAVGALVKDTGTLYNGKPIVWKIADKGHSGYPSGSVTLITEKHHFVESALTLSNQGTATATAVLTAITAGSYSNIRQWLNSHRRRRVNGTAQSTAQTRPRRMPTYGAITTNTIRKRASLPGSPRTSARPCWTQRTPSASQARTAAEPKLALTRFSLRPVRKWACPATRLAARKLALFSNDSSRLAYPTAECREQERIHERQFAASNAPWYWWLCRRLRVQLVQRPPRRFLRRAGLEQR